VTKLNFSLWHNLIYCIYNFRSVPFHDIHREVPESGLPCDSISLSQNTEPSVGTIQIAETLNLQLKYPLASRQEQNCTPDTTDSAIDSARSSTVMANVYQESMNNQPQQPNTVRKVIHVDHCRTLRSTDGQYSATRLVILISLQAAPFKKS